VKDYFLKPPFARFGLSYKELFYLEDFTGDHVTCYTALVSFRCLCWGESI